MQSIIFQHKIIIKFRIHRRYSEENVLYFFYIARNILGLIMVISPLSGLLFIDFNSDLFIVFLAGVVLGVPIGVICLKTVPFRIWTNLAALVFLSASAGFVSAEKHGVPWFFMAVMGICIPVLAAVLPANIVSGWFRGSKVQVLGLVWTSSLTLGLLLEIIMKRFTYPAFVLAAVMMLAGTGIFLQKPPGFAMPSLHAAYVPFHAAHKQKSVFKISLFGIYISAQKIPFGVYFINGNSVKDDLSLVDLTTVYHIPNILEFARSSV